MTYDAGFVTGDTVRTLDLALVRREMAIIRDDLHCNAVHVVGGDADNLEAVARAAAGAGLEVWFSPYPIDRTPEEILALFEDCAERAERLRAGGAEVVFVAGVELSIMNRGFVDGDRLGERIANLRGQIPAVRARLDAFLRTAVAAVRARFGGRVTYAAIPFEDVDWELFDIVTLELIRSAAVAGQFRDGVRRVVAQPKPVAVTGFGCATWRGAADVAPHSMQVQVFERDEDGQAQYLRELLDIFDGEGVDSAFVHLFALYDLPHRPDGDPRDDLDLGSLGIVKVLEGRTGRTYPGLPWEPKAAFAAVGEQYAAQSVRSASAGGSREARAAG